MAKKLSTTQKKNTAKPKPKSKEPQFKRAQTQIAGSKFQKMKTLTTEKGNKTHSNSSDNFSIDEELLKDTDSDSGIYDNYGNTKKDKLN